MFFTLLPRFDLPLVKLELYLQDSATSFLFHPIFLSPSRICARYKLGSKGPMECEVI